MANYSVIPDAGPQASAASTLTIYDRFALRLRSARRTTAPSCTVATKQCNELAKGRYCTRIQAVHSPTSAAHSNASTAQPHTVATNTHKGHTPFPEQRVVVRACTLKHDQSSNGSPLSALSNTRDTRTGRYGCTPTGMAWQRHNACAAMRTAVLPSTTASTPLKGVCPDQASQTQPYTQKRRYTHQDSARGSAANCDGTV